MMDYPEFEKSLRNLPMWVVTPHDLLLYCYHINYRLLQLQNEKNNKHLSEEEQLKEWIEFNSMYQRLKDEVKKEDESKGI